jgi:hypothetical protein
MPNPMDPAQPQRPEYPKSPEQPVVPPDDPNRPDVDREPNIDPPPTVPPMEAPSEKPVITEPPSPRAQPAALQSDFPGLSSFAWIAAVVISVATLPAQVADNVTVQLRNGQVVRGALEDLEGGTLYVRVSRDDQRRLPIGEVALIDRVGGASGLPQTELQEARRPEHLAFLTSGGSITGKLVDISGGAGAAAGEEGKERRFIFQLPDGTQRSVPGTEVGRVYLGSYSLQGEATAASEGQPAQGGAIRVPANGQWVPTPYRVRTGQRLGFNVSGQVRLSSNPDDVASSAGGSRKAPEAPVPNAPAGALIGRIGEDGAPFPIGNLPAVQMPGSGLLYLSINDGERSDNSGEFTVLIDPRNQR